MHIGDIVVRDLRCYQPIEIYENPGENGSKSVGVNWLNNDNAILQCLSDGTVQVYDLHR